MRRLLPALASLVLSLMAASQASAQSAFARPIAERTAIGAGRIVGVVTDQAGTTLGGVSVVALGTALAMAKTDIVGRFTLSLPPGQYVLRATREGYVSTYREAVRIQSDVALRRSITLVRTGEAVADQPSPMGADEVVDVRTGRSGDHAHTETAWRLRHLDRTVLREVSVIGEPGGEALRSDFVRDVTPVDWLVGSSARAASSFFSDTDFNGQLNFLATSAVSASGIVPSEQWGRGVAYVVLGAPVGMRGDWSVRAAVAPGDTPSWNLQAEYQAREDQNHVFNAGWTYSIQPDSGHLPVRSSMATAEASRRVGGVYGFDVWTVRPGLTLDYGARLERYDYLDDPQLLSGRIGIRTEVDRHLAFVATASSGMVAPGAAEFAPPERSGAWLPPERTFSTLSAGPFRPEQVVHYSGGVDATIVEGTVVTLRRFSEVTRDQIATVFGLDDETDVGHYYVATSGTVDVQGIAVGVDSRLFDSIAARITYTRSESEWSDSFWRRRLSRVAPSLVRTGPERGHDLTAAVDATMPATATRLSVAYRLSTLFSTRGVPPAVGRTGGRFSLELRQQLPYRPLGQGEFNILVSARTLLRGLTRDGAFYDEIMTLAPPLQVACGIQMRF
jgi:hypothetical protein